MPTLDEIQDLLSKNNGDDDSDNGVDYEKVSPSVDFEKASDDDEDVQDAANNEEQEAESPAPISQADQLRQLVNKANGKDPVAARMNTSDAIGALLGQRKQQLASAQNLQNNLQLLAGLQHAGETAGSALVPLSRVKPDEQSFQSNMAKAQQPVQNVLQNQALEGQAVKEALTKAQAQKAIDEQSPDTQVSQAFRNAILTTDYGKQLQKTLGSDQFNLITASDKDKIFDLVKLQEQTSMRKEIADQNHVYKQSVLDRQLDQKMSDGDAKARQAVLSFRGNSGSQQASKDIVNANKALALIDQPGIKTNQDLQLIAQELGKVASSGVPGAHEIYALMPSNLKTEYAKLVNFLASKPTDAQANEYLQRNKQYLNEIRHTAIDTLNKYQLSMAKGFRNKMHPDEYKSLVSDINNMYTPTQSSSQMVQVLNPATGKTHTMSSDDAKQAVAAGGQLVQ